MLAEKGIGMSRVCIDAIQWYFGCTKTEAKKLLKEMPANSVENIVLCFGGNAKRAFIDD